MPSPNFLNVELAPGLTPDDLIFTETAEYEKGFSDYFDAKLRPVLLQENENRLACLKETKRRMRKAIPIIAAIFIVAFMATARWSTKDNAPFLRIAFFAAALTYGWTRMPKINYRQRSKNKILPIVAGYYGFLTYREESPILDSFLRDTRIIPPGDPTKRQSTDHLYGTYRGTPLESWQLTTSRGSGKRSKRLYSGLLIHFGLKKMLGETTMVKFRQGTSNSALFDFTVQGLEPVSLEDPDFEKLFDVYSGDQTEARYLLPPDVMQNLKELSVLFGGVPVDCCFTGQHAFISIRVQKPLFEPPPAHKAPIMSNDIHAFLNQMHHIFRIIEDLDIDRR